MTLIKAEKYLESAGLQKFRLDQFRRGYYLNLNSTIDEFTELSKDLREELKANSSLDSLTAIKENIEANSMKVLFKTADDKNIESVLISEKDRNTVCVSTQIGCPVGCQFCATGTLGLSRNLTTDEIVEQVIYFARLLKKRGQKVTNVVYMGMGEPTLNLENVKSSLQILNDEKLFGLGMRNFTISTVGIINILPSLLESKNQFRIAISLHAPSQQLREQLIPIARQNPFDKLLAITKNYALKQNKRVTYEYIMLKDINDSLEDAQKLAELFRGLEKLTFINLIMYNTVIGKPFVRSSNSQAHRFADILRQNHIPCYIRFSGGEEINGACGQLAGNDY